MSPAEETKRTEWDAATYHRVSAPHVEWGRKVLAQLKLRGDETVLDAGCGTGRLTAELIEMLPRGRVVALDVSENMLATAREHLEERYRGRVGFIRADLLALPFSEDFDGIFSTATFHWVLDHDLLFENLHRALRPGGWLRAQCGGGPNLSRFMARVETLAARPPFSVGLADHEKPVFYSDAAGAAERMQRAGFTEVETWLEYAPASLADAAAYAEFVTTVILRHQLERLPDAALRDELIAELARLAGQDDPPYQLDYWRLNMRGRRGA